MYQFLQYLKFLISSKNAHGIHSPFVYDMLTNCLYDDYPYPAYETLYQYRHQLLHDRTSLAIKDLGAGSKHGHSSKKEVRTIAKHSGSSFRQAKVLFRLAHYFKPKQVLELGSSLGIATQALSLGHGESNIVSVEGSPSVAELTENRLSASNIKIVTASFQDYLRSLTDQTFDLVYIDGHHTKDATITHFNQLLRHCHENSIFIFDDIYWSRGMTEAWQYIKDAPEVSLTVDIFFKGLVFFKKERHQQHFKIRV